MTPESCYGRLVNLREQLTDPKKTVNIDILKGVVFMSEKHYSESIDDLDDIIRCIKRGMKCDCKSAPSIHDTDCPVWNPPDSEDMEAR